jgi:hypothetical protein
MILAKYHEKELRASNNLRQKILCGLGKLKVLKKVREQYADY